MNELTVILKDSERTYRHKFMIYEKFTVSQDDPIVIECKEEAKKVFGAHPDQIQVKIHMEITE